MTALICTFCFNPMTRQADRWHCDHCGEEVLDQPPQAIPQDGTIPEVDPLAEEAFEYIKAHPDCRVVDIQHVFKIGYCRAARLKDAAKEARG